MRRCWRRRRDVIRLARRVRDGIGLCGKPGFADMEALRAVGAVEAVGASTQFLGIHIPIPSRSFTKRGND